MEPFRFTSVVQLTEALGRRARDEQELLELLEEVPLDSIHTHTSGRLLRFEAIDAMFPNDFAAWAAREVRDQVLGERLGVIDPFDFPTLETLRNELVTTLDDHLSRIAVVPRVIHGEAFHFMRARLVEVPSGIEAHDLETFERALERVDASSIYQHLIESRTRHGIEGGDFAAWTEKELRMPELARDLARVSPFSASLESMRTRLLAIVRRHRAVAAPGKEAA